MKRLAQITFAIFLASGVPAAAQTYTYVDLGVAPYSDTFGQSASSDIQAGYGLVNGVPQALTWQSTAASATPLPSTISQPVGPSAANLIVIGDSITAGVDGFPQNASSGYPAVMQGLGMGQSGSLVYNLGLPGEKTGDMLGQYNGATGTTSVTTTVTTTSGSFTATIGNATGVTTGMSIGAVGIPPDTTISAISGTTITLSNKATATDNAVTCSIATPVQDVSAGTGLYPGGAANSWSNFNNTAHQLSNAISGLPAYCFILSGTNDITAIGPSYVMITTTAGSPNATIAGSNFGTLSNGDVLTSDTTDPNNLSSNPPPYIVSGGGTPNIVLSTNATGTGTSNYYAWTPTTPMATIESNYTALVATAHADGDTPANGGGVIALTLLPRGNSTTQVSWVNDVLLTEFNAWLKSGASGADYLFDTNSALPPFGPATSSAYYFSDQLHLSAQGTSLVGNYINQQFFAQLDSAAASYQNAEALSVYTPYAPGYAIFAAGYGLNSQGQSNALLWNGLTQPPVNLNPSFAKSSVANAVSYATAMPTEAGSAILPSGQQVAVYWRGTAASATNLNPTGATSSQAYATCGGAFVFGSAVFSGVTHAVIFGDPNPSLSVDLNPSGALRSEALGVTFDWDSAASSPSPAYVEVGDYTTSAGAVHACIWLTPAATVSGLNPSFSQVDLHPASGYSSTTAVSVQGTAMTPSFQGAVAGYGTKTNGTTVALLWTNTSNTASDLSTYLPAGTTYSRATAVDYDNSVTGTAIINGSNHAFVLRPSHVPTITSPPQSLSTLVNVPYTYDVSASGFPTPTFSTTATLPPGLSISPTTGVISGTPTQTGTFTGTIVATNTINGAQQTASQNFSIKVVAAPYFQMSVVGSLNPANGTGRHQAMTLGPDGNFYGTCSTGGVLNAGTIFEMTPAGAETTVHDFGDGSVAYDGSQPEGLSFGSDGTLYGTTYAGGSNGQGTVFNINQGTETILHNFGSSPTDGANPATSMVQGGDGNFYGVTVNGGGLNTGLNSGYGGGTVFSITPTGTLSIQSAFGADFAAAGASLDCPLTQYPASSTNFYGVTFSGADLDVSGTLFEIDRGLIENFYSFDAGILFAGYRPHSPVTMGTDGNLYGICSAGGTSVPLKTSDPSTFAVTGIGTIYKNPGNKQTDIHNFGDGTVGNDGANTAERNAPLVQGADGNFYGVTPAGGSANQGCLFQITPSGTMQVLHSFGDGTIPNDGTDPGPVFFLGPDGYTFYGITQKGGVNGDGVIYKFTIGVAPAFAASIKIPSATVNVPYSYTLGATGYPTPTFALANGSSLPPGLSLSSNGQISGTPTISEVNGFFVTASNGVGSGVTGRFVFGVLDTITNGPPPTNIPIGVPFTFTYASGPSSFDWYIYLSKGTLPTGLTIPGDDDDGIVTGTPTSLGLYTGTMALDNGIDPDPTQNFSITVTNTYANWAAQAGLTGQSAAQNTILEPDGLTNLMKYALGLNPTTIYNPGSASLPFVQPQIISGTEYLTLTFTGVATDVTYTVQASNSPAGPWSPIATYSDVYPAPGTVTVQDTQAVGVSSSRYLQLQVTSP